MIESFILELWLESFLWTRSFMAFNSAKVVLDFSET
jgi:hypothetical protein